MDDAGAAPASSAAAPGLSRFSNAAVAAISLIVVLLLTVSAMAGYLIWREYRTTIEQAETRATSTANAAAAHVRWLMEASQQALRRIEDAVNENDATASATGTGDLNAIIEELPDETFVWVFDADGDALLSTTPETPQLNVGNREYFRALQGGDEWHVSRLITGRLSGRKSFAVAHRLERDGVFAGVAAVIIDADLMSRFWATLGLEPGSTIGLFRDDGWLVARYPIPEAAIDLSRHRLFTEYLPRSGSGLYSSASSPADQVARTVGYQRVPGFPLVVVAGISRDVAMAQFWSRLGVIGAVGVPLVLALMAISGSVAVLLRRDERTRRDLAEALEHNRTLFREIHHRVKNNLQVVSALVQLQPGSSQAKSAMTRRLAAMSAVHEQIYGSDQFGQVDLAVYLDDLVGNLKETYGSAAAVKCDLAPLTAGTDVAVPLALIASEVVSNAFKHAFADGRAGTLTVSLEPKAENTALLRIEDDGMGFDPGARKSGMGMKLINGLCRQIGAACEFKNDRGTVFLLTFPVAGPAVPVRAHAEQTADPVPALSG